MQTLASGVGDLKKVLTNIKVRGTWGEMQLGNLLEQILAPEQYDQNVQTKPDSGERVEFALKLPGRDERDGEAVWLPIDAKFPKEDYERLVDASERGDPEAVEEAGKQLENRIKLEAKDIRDKYIDPPHTTDFGILYLSTEGLYAEVLRRPGLMTTLQRDYRVNVTGPTTLAALLNSLQMGFRTLAIQKRSSEVWNLLGAIKGEFKKFGEVIEKVETKIREAGNVIEKAKTRSRAIERKLRGVEELPAPAAQAILGPAEAADAEDEETVQEDGAADPEKG
jgi:DNA recombination protein RmuC